MRPERSVMHSPRLTKRNGVETRMAPPSTASGTVQSPIDPSAMSGLSFKETDTPVERVAGEHEDEDDSLQNHYGRVRQPEPSLEKSAAGADAAEQDGDRNDGERILPGEEGNEDTGEAVAGGQIGVGAALHSRDFDHPRETCGSTREETDGQNQLADGKADDLCRADIAAGHARRKAEHGVINQNIGGHRRDQ